MDKKENIKELYQLIEGKTKFIKELSVLYGMSPNTIRNHWFSEHGFWGVPEKKQDEVIEIMQNKIRNQKQLV